MTLQKRIMVERADAFHRSGVEPTRIYLGEKLWDQFRLEVDHWAYIRCDSELPKGSVGVYYGLPIYPVFGDPEHFFVG